ncbi:MAG TPA: OmpA family protein, partial [Methylococcaceae bacterium]|nr:OmpA family protein [Methylococcaceae bacterium]
MTGCGLIEMMKLKRVLLSCFLASSTCYAEYFSASLFNADWKVEQATASCRLKQNIPLYGVADFLHQTGESLRFSISEERFKPDIVKASLTIDVPPWRHQAVLSKVYLLSLDLAGGNQSYPRLSVYGVSAEFMLDALLKGMYPTFSYARATVGGLSPEVSVAVSAINFAKNYQQFDDCRKGFLPGGFKQRLEKSLFFKPGSQALNIYVLKQLTNAARYVKEVQGAELVIVSDTAIAGGRDNNWFVRRAKVIKGKLNDLGVANNKVSIKAGAHMASSDSQVIHLNVFGPDSLSSIYYRKGNTQLTATERQRLTLLMKYAQVFFSDRSLIISSYTDSIGKKANNLKVSQQRGDVIKHYLISQGMDEKKLQVRAYGERHPAKSNRFPRGRAQNRR